MAESLTGLGMKPRGKVGEKADEETGKERELDGELSHFSKRSDT